MSKITFIIGGARSGKSRMALKLAKEKGQRIAFIATCEPRDKEMQRRIVLHQKSRPRHWHTFEEPRMISSLLKKMGGKFDCVIIDCLTLLVSNLLLGGAEEKEIEREIKAICGGLKLLKSQAIIVSNEVGMAIVPENKLARDFRDIAGKANQIVASKAEEVYFMVAGLPWKVK